MNDVVATEYEAYQSEAVQRLEAIARTALATWPQVERIALWHRTGLVNLSEPSVVVAASARPRADSFRAAEFCIDVVKQSVPVWKNEHGASSKGWVTTGPVVPQQAVRASDVARRYALADGSLAFGIIASVSEPFCGSCTRLRVTAEGRLHTCLFSSEGLDLTSVLRGARQNGDLRSFLDGTWRPRDDQYSSGPSTPGSGRATKVEMSYLGG